MVITSEMEQVKKEIPNLKSEICQQKLEIKKLKTGMGVLEIENQEMKI